jgi:two-component system alkaline phosphatase synthesis response regulator PhoP
MAKILIVEDEEDLWRGLQRHLQKEGYAVAHCGRGDTAVSTVLREAPDLIVLDVMLPGASGIDVCRELRARGIEVPIIMLTARSEEIDRVVGLEMGADDYVTKPFGVKELLARVRVRLRRDTAQARAGLSRYRFGDIEVNFDAHEVTRNGQRLELSPKELEVLRLLIRFRGEVVSRERMLHDIWGFDEAPNTRTVDTHILKLRQKLEEDPARPRFLLSIYGEGYKFVG